MKKRTIIIGSILAIALSSAGIIYAECGSGKYQRGGHKGHHLMHVIKQLDLTKEKRKTIRKIMNESRDQMDENRDEMADIRKALQEQRESTTFNVVKVRELADAKAKIMADMTVHKSETMHQIRQELSSEQLEKMGELKDRHSKHDRH